MDALEQYIHLNSQAEEALLTELDRETHRRMVAPRMLSGHLQGKLLMLLTRMLRPKRVREIGTFTGYSAICLASALPEDGHLDTLELNDELEDLILEGFERAGLQKKISLLIGDCKETLKGLRMEMGLTEEPCGDRQSEIEDDGCEVGADTSRLYDIVYMDANKREYCEYYDLVFDMVRPGGLILADNVLWDGKVCQDPLPQDKQTLSIARFNDMVSADPRVESVILPIRDGLNVIRKK